MFRPPKKLFPIKKNLKGSAEHPWLVQNCRGGVVVYLTKKNMSGSVPPTLKIDDDDDDVVELTRSNAGVGAKRILDLVSSEEQETPQRVTYAAKGVPKPTFGVKQPKTEVFGHPEGWEDFEDQLEDDFEGGDDSGIDLHKFFQEKGVRLDDAISLCSAFVRYGNATKKANSLRNRK